MHEYIAKFGEMAKHAYSIKAKDSSSATLASNFIEGMPNPYIKNTLRSYQVKNLKEIFGHAIQKDQKQKIRALDFRATISPGSANKANCSINAIRNDGCFKCGSEEHFIQDCLLNQTDHDTHAGCKVTKNGDILSDKVMEPLSRFFTNLVEQIKLLMSSGHGSPGRTPTCNTSHRQRFMGSYNGHGWQSNDQPNKREEPLKDWHSNWHGQSPYRHNGYERPGRTGNKGNSLRGHHTRVHEVGSGSKYDSECSSCWTSRSTYRRRFHLWQPHPKTSSPLSGWGTWA